MAGFSPQGVLPEFKARASVEGSPVLSSQRPVAVFWDLENIRGWLSKKTARQVLCNLCVQLRLLGQIKVFNGYRSAPSGFDVTVRQAMEGAGITLIDSPKGPDSADKHMIVDLLWFAKLHADPRPVIVVV